MISTITISYPFINSYKGNARKSTISKKRQRPSLTPTVEASRVNDDGPGVVQEGGKRGKS